MKYSNITRQLIKNFLEWESETVYPEIVLMRKETASRSELDSLRQQVENCHKCLLGQTRIKAVFGRGSPVAKIMFVGEGPGYQEDHEGLPFVGRAGQLLDSLLKEIGLESKDVYITNVVKCHPMIDPTNPEKRGNDRPPHPEEIQACLPYLRQQIEIIQPEVICALGGVAGQVLTGLALPLGRMRQQIYNFGKAKVLVTYHPAAILRNGNFLPYLKEDLRALKELISK